jgi:hypothetical protein
MKQEDHPDSHGRTWNGTDFKSVTYSNFILLFRFTSRKNLIREEKYAIQENSWARAYGYYCDFADNFNDIRDRLFALPHPFEGML